MGEAMTFVISSALRRACVEPSRARSAGLAMRSIRLEIGLLPISVPGGVAPGFTIQDSRLRVQSRRFSRAAFEKFLAPAYRGMTARAVVWPRAKSNRSTTMR